jgi:purine-binding chemotaxis protein CheW
MNAIVTQNNTQYLSFQLESETFALEIIKVREVLDYTTATTIPLTPDFMRGVINLRGSAVPVVDLRVKFGMPGRENTTDTCIIIVEASVHGEPVLIGALADAVEEVFDLEDDMIEPPPSVGINMSIDFIRGMGKRDDDFIIILDIDRVFSEDDLAMAEKAMNNGEKKEQ